MHSKFIAGLLLIVCLWPGISYPQQDQNVMAGGSPAEMELQTFGRYLQADKLSDITMDGFRRFNLSTIRALYENSQQFGQVLRLCKVSEVTAQSDNEKVMARDCMITSLLNLGRYSEAEELFLQGDKSPLKDDFMTPLWKIVRWKHVAALALHQGEMAMGVDALNAIHTLTSSYKELPLPTELMSNTSDVGKWMQQFLEDSLQAAQRDSLLRLARVAYFRQDAREYINKVDDLLRGPKGVEAPETNGTLAIDLAWPLVRIGKRELAVALARKVHGTVKADAGFRDQKEPLHEFGIFEAASKVLGDERTSKLHVRSRLRLVRVYILLGRTAEAERLLANVHSLAGSYVLEEYASNTLLAEVEEAQADLMSELNQHLDSIRLLRSARSRYQLAMQSERSSSIGRRHQEFDSPLLSVSARILAELAISSRMPIKDPAIVNEVLGILSDFSESRSGRNARQANRKAMMSDGQIRDLLEQEGLLIDQLMDLRASLSPRTHKRGELLESQISDTRAKMAVILAEIRSIKTRIGISSTGIGENTVMSLWDSLASSLPPEARFWQWVIHPNGNVTVSITRNGMVIKPLHASVEEISNWVNAVRESASLAKVEKPTDIREYHTKYAAALFNALFQDVNPKDENGGHWILAVPKLLDLVPWAALVTDIKSDSTRRPRWLVEDVAITLAPSVEVWIGLHKRKPSQAKMAFLGIGDPKNEGYVKSSDLVVRGALVSAVEPSRTIAPTSNSAFSYELRKVSELFPPKSLTVLTGLRATKKQLLSLPLLDYRALLFSTHGFLAGEVYKALGPALELTASMNEPRDRYLTSSEIATMRLDADVVFLSACNTSASDGSKDAEGFSGLTSTFLLAGARSVVATLWEVETTATSMYVKVAMQEYQTAPQKPFSYSLRKAAVTMMNGPTLEWRHPAFWSPFVVVGR